MRPRFELIEHTADIFIKAYGRTTAEAFGAVAEAMFVMMVDDSPIDGSEPLQIEVKGIDEENLLVAFLSELILIHETRNLVMGKIDVTQLPGCHLIAHAMAERFDEQKHRHGLMFKAVSYHLMEIMPPEGDQPAYVKVLFDI